MDIDKLSVEELVKFLEYMNKNIKDELLDVDTFIKKHTHICYCEAIVNREGLICYVKPNHIQTIIRLLGKTEEEIYKEMPVSETPIEWLVNRSGFIAVWYEGCIMPKDVSEAQKNTLDKLISNNIIKKVSFGFDK